MADNDGLLYAYLLDGQGGGTALGWDAVRSWEPSQGTLWMHLDRTNETAVAWVENESGINPAAAATLLARSGNRPRSDRIGDAMLMILRGINRNPGDEPDDMLAMHAWLDAHRIITLRRRRLMAGAEIRDLIESGHGPHNAAEMLVLIIDRMAEPVAGLLTELDEQVDTLHDEVLGGPGESLREKLRHLRQSIISLRRYLAPQRDAMSRLLLDQPSWVGDLSRSYLREHADRYTRFVEDLDAARERTGVAQDELNARVADQMNRTMYLLTVVSALLLPPALLTGLLGINVGGMPGVDSDLAFTVVAIVVPILAVFEFVLLRRLKWI